MTLKTMSATKDRLNIMLDKLRERQCRITPQRVAILKQLASSTTHPTVETIFEKVKVNFPTTSRADSIQDGSAA